MNLDVDCDTLSVETYEDFVNFSIFDDDEYGHWASIPINTPDVRALHTFLGDWLATKEKNEGDSSEEHF